MLANIILKNKTTKLTPRALVNLTCFSVNAANRQQLNLLQRKVNKDTPSSIATNKNFKSNQLIIDKNIKLNFANEDKLATNLLSLERKKLVVLFSWMLANDVHIEKYRQLYFKHGFDVLTVKLSPIQFLLPTVGAQVVANNVLNFLLDAQAKGQYEQLLVHASSVGGYVFAEVMVKFFQLSNSDPGQRLDDSKNQFLGSFKGIVLDSVAYLKAMPEGFSKVLIGKAHPLQPALEGAIKKYLDLGHSFATKHYLAADGATKQNIKLLNCPALFLVSKADLVGTVASNREMADCWQNSGIDVHFKIWQDSGHVAHYHMYPNEYETEISNFISKLKLK